MLLLQSKNNVQNQTKVENTNCNLQNTEQNKNLNESQITTSTSSISVNNKKNMPHNNYKTPKKKNFQIPLPKQKNAKQPNSKNPENKQKNQNSINNLIYTKGTIKKLNNIISDNNKIYGRSMSQITIEDNNKKLKNSKINNNILPLMNNKSQLYSQSEINQNQNQMKKNINQVMMNKKK